ncbi:MAG: SurA N-terminal domain-containing protein [Azospira sp.]|jgi:peptidyl-prolyl cis-trans isomerase D|nr:SurA N-terminal domain-containing protein [Azospira sp.]
MFDSVRNNKKIVQVLLLLIAASFTLYGVDSYVSGAGAGDEIARVGDSRISRQDFQQAWRDQMDREREQQGANFRSDRFDTPETRLAIANALVDRRLLLLEAMNGRLGASDALLAEIIGNMPSLLDENGRFSPSLYEEAVRRQGMTVEQFEAQMRHDLTMQQLVGAIGDTGMVSAASAETLLRIQAEERQVAEVRVLPEQFADSIKLEGDAAQKFYDGNRKLFELPERVSAEYVVLSLDSLLAQTQVGEDEIRQWYDGRQDIYQQAEERRASHILIAAGATAADKDKARAKAGEILAEVRKNPAAFAELAERHSQDPGSARSGGDLGFFGRGMMVKPFDDAVFGLQENAISDVVESDFGFHIIRLTGIKPARQKPFAEVRDEIAGELRRQAAQRRYAEAAEVFSNMVYEQSDSLAPVIEKFGLKAEISPQLPRNPPAQALPALGVLGNERLLEALFSEDATKHGRNTEAIEVAPNVLVSARVAEYQPASVRPFESVSEDIVKMLLARETTAAARARGEETLARLRAGEDDVKWALVKSVSRLQGRQVPPVAMQAIFRADVSKLPAYTGVELPNNGGYALYKIIAVKPLETIDPDKRRALQADYTAVVAQEDFAAYLAGLRKRHKVTVNTDALVDRER